MLMHQETHGPFIPAGHPSISGLHRYWIFLPRRPRRTRRNSLFIYFVFFVVLNNQIKVISSW